MGTASSVAGGARASPIGPKSMQNSTFLVLLRPISAPKLKTGPPKGVGSRSCEGLAVIWTRIVEPSKVGEDLFFFGDHLIFNKKSPQSYSRLMKIWVKFLYGGIKLPKKPPPPFAKSWLRARAQLTQKLGPLTAIPLIEKISFANVNPMTQIFR